MTPDDLRTVTESWREFLRERDALQSALERQFLRTEPSPEAAMQRARWLFGAVEELVEFLPVPSRLEVHAREIAAAWPDPLSAPSYAVDGVAWMAAACECLPSWTELTATAWRQAWRLLSDVLAAETLSPFAVPCRTPAPDA